MIKGLRLWISIVLIIIIIVTGIYMIKQWDKLSRNEVVITYPDRCKETYINGNLTSPICVEGRLLMGKTKPMPSYNLNITGG